MVEGGVDAISKIRGIDVLKVNTEVKELKQTLQKVENEKTVLQKQLKNIEAEIIINQHLLNLNFKEAPQNIQILVIELIKQINLKNLKLTQEDQTQYIVFKTASGDPLILIGNFGPEKLTLIVSNPAITDVKNYDLNLNAWHGVNISEIDKRTKELLN